MRAIQAQEFGGPEVLELVELPEPQPSDGQVAIDVIAAGVNYADTHSAENAYLVPQELPLVPGQEVVGTTPEGKRVVALMDTGGYAERVVADPKLVFEVPDGVTDEQALAVTLQGVTAWHLLRTCGHLAEGESVVVFAAAGGVGSTAIQLARAWGAGRVIAAASTEPKRELAQQLGADAVVDSTASGLKEALIEANEGREIDVILEMTGGDTFSVCLDSLAKFGRLVHYGIATRQPASEVYPTVLMMRSVAVIGFWLAHCSGKMVREALEDLLRLVDAGELDPQFGRTYPLGDARRAHEDLRGRQTTGKLALDPRS
jgi:NADPH2:quinone reductase